MKRLTLMAILGLVARWFLACSGGEAMSCQDVCGKMVECDGDVVLSECLDTCKMVKDVTRGGAFDTMGQCILDAACEEMDVEACLEQAASAVPDDVADGLIDAVCDKMVECSAGQMTTEMCITMIDEYFGLVKVFKNSVLNCLADCMGGVDCARIFEIEDEIDACVEECGIDLKKLDMVNMTITPQ